MSLKPIFVLHYPCWQAETKELVKQNATRATLSNNPLNLENVNTPNPNWNTTSDINGLWWLWEGVAREFCHKSR